jgi:hypothetical protein
MYKRLQVAKAHQITKGIDHGYLVCGVSLQNPALPPEMRR